MARSVGVLGTERGTESVDCAKCSSSKLSLKLSRHGEAGLLAKEVLRVVNLAGFLVLGEVVQVESCHLEHRSGTLAVARCDKRSVKVEETALLEEAVNGKCQCAAHAQHCSEGVGAWTQVCFLAKELKRVPLFLEWIRLAIGSAVDFYGLCLYFRSLSLALRCHKHSLHVDA